MKEKTKQLLVYIIKNHSKIPTTRLMKLAYLADLMSIEGSGSQISDFEYIRYNYGPFDKKIYEYIECLVWDGIISPESNYTPSGDEYIVYFFNEELENFGFDKISDVERNIIEDLTEKLKGYGAKTITEITYKTKPMQALGATLGLTLATIRETVAAAILKYGDQQEVILFDPCGDILGGLVKLEKYNDEIPGLIYFEGRLIENVDVSGVVPHPICWNQTREGKK